VIDLTACDSDGDSDEQQKRKSRSSVSKTVPKSAFQRKQEKLRKVWAAKKAKGGASNFLRQWSALGGA
jgi:hypothetical protein